jgi:hypothetical protein
MHVELLCGNAVIWKTKCRWKENIKMDRKGNKLRGCRVESVDGPMFYRALVPSTLVATVPPGGLNEIPN